MNGKPVNDGSSLPDGIEGLYDAEQIEDIRLQMVKFARLQLSDNSLAEDVVQEAFLGALRNSASFRGQSAFKTWMFAILKHKIADLLRKRHRESQVFASDTVPDIAEQLFDQKGHWVEDEKPKPWHDPEEAFINDLFWQVFEVCLNNLPPYQGRIFMMREFVGLDSDEICAELSLTTNNLYVQLHRARLRLQKCLSVNWFEEHGHD